jgi:hypothetical protein
MARTKREQPNSSNRKGTYRATTNKNKQNRPLAKKTGREWADHKYIEKRKSKSGKTVYIYDGAGTSGFLGDQSYNVISAPHNPNVYFLVKRNKRDYINTDVEKAKSELAKKQIGRGMDDLKKAISNKDADKAMKAASTTAEGVGSFLSTSMKALAGPAWNTIQDGIGFVKDAAGILETGINAVYIDQGLVDWASNNGPFLHK